ncbi:MULTISPECIES: hypothetical protein [unclassified Endozoicomonas]|uniref:hypothetical protein n=2 Tax=unclassified Endozoicomonas TaxID=2644528 RepID=UPI003BB6629B
MLFNSLKKTGSLALFLVSVLSLQTLAKNDSIHEYRRPPSMLPEDISKLKPTVLLCFVSNVENADNLSNDPGKPEECKEHIGYVTTITSEKSSTHVCRYHANGSMQEEFTNYDWLDAGFYTIDGFMHIHTTEVTIPGSKNYYYVMRTPENCSRVNEPMCAYVDKQEGKISFGYEQNDNGSTTCGKRDLVKAVYDHSYERINCAKRPQDHSSPFIELNALPDSCPSDAVTTHCHNCNGNGCGAFKCSAFTYWDPCPDDTFCGSERCVGGLCEDKPWCRPATLNDEL